MHPRRAMFNAARWLSVAAGLGAAVLTVLPAAAQESAPPAGPWTLPSRREATDSEARFPSASAGPSADPSAPPALTARQLYDHVRRGVVIIERAGSPAALGTVLAGDGRILTALSGLAGAEEADVRYADGTGVHAKLGYSDKGLDLALLAPESDRRMEGLVASEADPADTLVRAMVPGRGAHLGPAAVGLKGRADAHARDGALLRMWDVDVQGPPVVGAPLLDPAGDVLAVLVRACRGHARTEQAQPLPGSWPASPAESRSLGSHDSACEPVIVGAPVSAVRSFLARAAEGAAAESGPWLGIRGEPEDAAGMHGVRVVDVAPSSPAEKAGLKSAADVIVAVDGRPIDRPEALGESISKHAIGDSVKLLVFGGGKFREVTAVLRPAP